MRARTRVPYTEATIRRGNATACIEGPRCDTGAVGRIVASARSADEEAPIGSVVQASTRSPQTPAGAAAANTVDSRT